MSNIPEIFACMVFTDEVMKSRLSESVYGSFKKTIDEGKDLDIDTANAIAQAMKEWAIEKGATHYTHWFQPLTGITAEKHDSFIVPAGPCKVLMEFSGKELIKGESDASSFPSGGLRATFEARGYTAWDLTSYAFIKDDSLCIPTVFCSHSGEVLDKKTPLLRSNELVSKQALRIVKIFGHDDINEIIPNCGAEQEYFLVDKALAQGREDLKICGRTLFGASPIKGQELSDHYFGAIKPRVMEYMTELNHELWNLGIYAKTEHNEVAPAQHELAPVYSPCNIATDHNQLTMEIMKKVADRKGLVCLLHEKPFRYLNGSGKHVNWSLSTDTGINLLKSGKRPYENKLFLLMLTAVIRAVDEHQDLLRISVSSAANDNRLGGHEAPPSIVSVFLGDELTKIISCLIDNVPYCHDEVGRMNAGVHAVPDFKKDTSDRNRTSPFAFTGNKFEFRMPGSSQSIADPNIILNTIVADVLKEFADVLEASDNVQRDIDELIRTNLKAHERIIFNGNNYSKEWEEEAKKRGLSSFKSSVDAIKHLTDKKNTTLFGKHKIFTSDELRSRAEIMLDSYCKILHIEAVTMIDMADKQILPAAVKYSKLLSDTALNKKNLGIAIENDAELGILRRISELSNKIVDSTEELRSCFSAELSFDCTESRAEYFRDTVLTAMEELRIAVDGLESITAKEYWPYPTYNELLTSV
ncbi:MAG: glutamine synthetase type III [Ruminococcaceae bacterium]|nr:glutamine synthetase type III [Oscillospiraceae bacterium]